MTAGGSRRKFLKGAAVGLAGVAVTPANVFASSAGVTRAPAVKSGVKLGVASYSLRKFSRPEAIAMIKEIGTPYINIKSFHLPYESTAEEYAAARKDFADAGLTIVGGGTITFQEDTDEEVQKYFDYAKNSGMPLMVVTGAPEIMPRVEKFAKQYDIKVAIHNHGPEDKFYPAPADALKVIENMDPRMGLCIDVGHTTRTGTDVVAAIADAGPRLLDMHVKDLSDLMVRESQVIVGRGKMPIADIFRQLIEMDYQGLVNLEYEINADDPLPGMLESFAYMRGVLAGLGAPSVAESIG